MSEKEEDNDYKAPEELTSEQGVQQDEEMRKVQRENKGKECHRQWAQKKTPRPSQKDESIQDVIETETDNSQDNRGMLPSDIVELLAAQSEEEKTEKKSTSKKKRPKKRGLEPVVLKDIPPAQCLRTPWNF